jgi:hypothetical protein
MGEFSRKPEGQAESAAKLKVAIALFLAATFGLLALLSVPVSTLIPTVPRVPQVIGGVFDPLQPLFPFLGDGLPIGPDVTPLGVLAGATAPESTGFQAANPTPPTPPPPSPPPPEPPSVPGPPVHRPPILRRCDPAGAVAGCRGDVAQHRIHRWLKDPNVKDRPHRPGDRVGQRVLREAQHLVRAAEVPARRHGPVWRGPRGARAR